MIDDKNYKFIILWIGSFLHNYDQSSHEFPTRETIVSRFSHSPRGISPIPREFVASRCLYPVVVNENHRPTIMPGLRGSAHNDCIIVIAEYGHWWQHYRDCQLT